MAKHGRKEQKQHHTLSKKDLGYTLIPKMHAWSV